MEGRRRGRREGSGGGGGRERVEWRGVKEVEGERGWSGGEERGKQGLVGDVVDRGEEEG